MLLKTVGLQGLSDSEAGETFQFSSVDKAVYRKRKNPANNVNDSEKSLVNKENPACRCEVEYVREKFLEQKTLRSIYGKNISFKQIRQSDWERVEAFKNKLSNRLKIIWANDAIHDSLPDINYSFKNIVYVVDQMRSLESEEEFSSNIIRLSKQDCRFEITALTKELINFSFIENKIGYDAIIRMIHDFRIFLIKTLNNDKKKEREFEESLKYLFFDRDEYNSFDAIKYNDNENNRKIINFYGITKDSLLTLLRNSYQSGAQVEINALLFDLKQFFDEYVNCEFELNFRNVAYIADDWFFYTGRASDYIVCHNEKTRSLFSDISLNDLIINGLDTTFTIDYNSIPSILMSRPINKRPVVRCSAPYQLDQYSVAVVARIISDDKSTLRSFYLNRRDSDGMWRVFSCFDSGHKLFMDQYNDKEKKSDILCPELQYFLNLMLSVLTACKLKGEPVKVAGISISQSQRIFYGLAKYDSSKNFESGQNGDNLRPLQVLPAGLIFNVGNYKRRFYITKPADNGPTYEAYVYHCSSIIPPVYQQENSNIVAKPSMSLDFLFIKNLQTKVVSLVQVVDSETPFSDAGTSKNYLALFSNHLDELKQKANKAIEDWENFPRT